MVLDNKKVYRNSNILLLLFVNIHIFHLLSCHFRFSFQFVKISIASPVIGIFKSVSPNNGFCLYACMLTIFRSFLKQIVNSMNTSFTSLNLNQFSCSVNIYATTAVVNLKHCYCNKRKKKNYAIC